MPSITIYTATCITCGVNSIYTRRVQAYGKAQGIPVTIINTKYDVDGRLDHANYLQTLNITDHYEPIVIKENGEVIKLREFTS